MALTVYQLKVVLRDVKPAVWRRVLVPGDATIRTLHETVQVAMGWANCHLHQFIIWLTKTRALESVGMALVFFWRSGASIIACSERNRTQRKPMLTPRSSGMYLKRREASR